MTTIDKLLRTRPRKLEIDGDEIFVRSLTVREYADSEALRADGSRWLDHVRWVVARCVVDADGSGVFTGDDDQRLQDISVPLLHRLAEEIYKASSGKPA